VIQSRNVCTGNGFGEEGVKVLGPQLGKLLNMHTLNLSSELRLIVVVHWKVYLMKM